MRETISFRKDEGELHDHLMEQSKGSNVSAVVKRLLKQDMERTDRETNQRGLFTFEELKAQIDEVTDRYEKRINDIEDRNHQRLIDILGNLSINQASGSNIVLGQNTKVDEPVEVDEDENWDEVYQGADFSEYLVQFDEDEDDE